MVCIEAGAEPARSDAANHCDSLMTPHIFNVTAQTQSLVPNVKFTNIDLARAPIYALCMLRTNNQGTHIYFEACKCVGRVIESKI